MFSIILNQYKRIDAYRKDLVFFYFYIVIDLVFTGGVFLTSAYPPVIAYLFTPNLISQAPLLYEMIFRSIKILSFVTPFIVTFFVLDRALNLMMKLQRIEQKLVQKLFNKIMSYYYKKYKKDPRLPDKLSKVLGALSKIQIWFLRRKVWQQYGIILSLFVLNNPYLLYIFQNF